MFCNQCEQTAKGQGCTVIGVCGKKPEVANLQNLLIRLMKGLASYIVAGSKVGVEPGAEINHYITDGLFATITNVNFDEQRLVGIIKEGKKLGSAFREDVSKAGGDVATGDALLDFSPDSSIEELSVIGENSGNGSALDAADDIVSLQRTTLYGLKGIGAYVHHARVLGKENPDIYKVTAELLAALSDSSLSLEDWVGNTLKTGEVNLQAMELLDAANTERYGHPVPVTVPLGHRKNKCILVSGHDLEDLEELLKQTEGMGIDLYTHGEMLPAHGYPKLKEYPHFYGHYGTAWQKKKKEFAEFPGTILMTTNCIQQPKDSYYGNIFTSGPVAWPGLHHFTDKNFKPLIDKALSLPGFTDDLDKGSVMTGFARNAVMGVADKVIDGVKSGAIKHIFLVGGCDGARSERSYYEEFVEKTPADTIVLTLACGKFRFFDKDIGSIGGIPRLLDMGQCNDAYSAIMVAVALAEAFDCGVNDLPLSLVLSWYEQKAVAILLTLLHLNIKNIRLGPTLPAFITPNVLDVLVKNFDIKPISTPDEDLAAILN